MTDEQDIFSGLVDTIKLNLGRGRDVTAALNYVYASYPETVAPSVERLHKVYNMEHKVTPDMVKAAAYALDHVLEGKRDFQPMSAEELGVTVTKRKCGGKKKDRSKPSKKDMQLILKYKVPKGMVPGFAAKAFTDVILQQLTVGEINEYAITLLEERLINAYPFRRGTLNMIYRGAEYCPRNLYQAIVQYWQDKVEDFTDAPREINTKELTRRMTPKDFDEKETYQPGEIIHKDDQFAVVLGMYDDFIVIAGNKAHHHAVS
jgi:hypothetical protein